MVRARRLSFPIIGTIITLRVRLESLLLARLRYKENATSSAAALASVR
jgi:hypothetical protein